MARMVTCRDCGKSFEKVGVFYKDGSRYICKRCGIKHTLRVDEAKRMARIARTGMKQTYLAMILKLFFGVFFVYTAFSSTTNVEVGTETEAGMALIGIILILWGLIPFLRRKKYRR